MMRLFLFILVITLCSCSEKIRFEALDSKQTGIEFNNKITEGGSMNVMDFEYLYNGAGVGIADLNKDGLQDIVFTGNQVSCKVYLNEGEFKFTDISANFEGLDNGSWHSGVAVADINSDGWLDVYLTCTAYNDSARRKNRLFINQGLQEDGQPVFKDMAESYGLADDSYSVHAAFFDYDLDGDLDLYLLNNHINDRLSGGFAHKVSDGSAPSTDDLFRNNGDGTFSHVSVEAGIVHDGFGLGLALGDVNKDGFPDIYVSNDYIYNDLLYINQGDGTFLNEIDTYLSYQTKSSMGNDMVDVNNDGNPEIFTLDMMPEIYSRKKQTIGGFGYIHYIYDAKYGYEHQYLRNMLHLHNGFVRGEMIPFSEVGQWMGIYQTEWSWSPLFADCDNDGDKDLMITNGYPRDMTDKDWSNYIAGVSDTQGTQEHKINKMPAVKVPNYAFENQGGLVFEKKNGEWYEETPSYSYGAAFADLDNDGDLDYVVNNVNDLSFVYRNNTLEEEMGPGNFLRIKLIGQENNSLSLGAKVEMWSAGEYQYHEQFISRGYASSVEPLVHFGLGNQELVDSVKVSWPRGDRVSILRNIQANQLLEVNERDAEAGFRVVPDQNKEGQLFSLQEEVFSYLHEQEDYVDFHQSQTIIPHKFSQIGPCIQKGDLDGDGMEDLLVGATNNNPTRVFLRRANGFVEATFTGLTQSKTAPESDLAILDVDGDGDNDVVALSGGYENAEEEYVHYLYENKGGTFTASPLPVSPFPASVVRPVDFDHDGDMDLFLGARVGLEIFPFAANSWLLINVEGEYKAENAISFYSGMVTDATWSDYDGDGWEDLLLAREWNSLAIIKNVNGQRLQIQEYPEIEGRHGIWYSITAGDFDQDGDEDYIAGNLGHNHRFTVSELYPLSIYALDLDYNGTLDPIFTGYWEDESGIMQEYPVHYFDDLMTQSPYFVRKVNDYTSFSHATLGDLLDSTVMKRVDYTLKTNTTSSYVIWNNGTGFSWEELPDLAQLSPIKKTIVQDFNGDGYPDVILAGNDHTWDISTGYFDANKGLVLLSKKDQPLSEVLTASESGIMFHGMVESLLYLEGEAPLILVGFNRDRAKVFSLKAD